MLHSRSCFRHTKCVAALPDISVLHLMAQSDVECHASGILGQLQVTNSCQARRHVSVCCSMLRLVPTIYSVSSHSLLKASFDHA